MFSRHIFSRNRWVAIIGGGLFIVLGLAGMLATDKFFEAPGDVLFGLIEINGAQNSVHVLLGAALVLNGLLARAAVARNNTILGTLCFVLGYYGLFIADAAYNVLALSSWGNAIHFASAAVLLAVGLGADLRARDAAGDDAGAEPGAGASGSAGKSPARPEG